MTDNIVAIDFNGVKVILDDNTELIRLSLASSVTNTPETLTNNIDGTNYQVPASKKATVIFFESGNAGDASQNLIQSDDDDGNTGAVTLLSQAGVDGMPDNTIFISAEVAATKFITMDSSSTAAHAIAIFIIEEAA